MFLTNRASVRVAVFALCVFPSVAQVVPFPMRETSGSVAGSRLQASPSALRDLARRDRVVLAVPLPDGDRAVLRLRRVSLRLGKNALHVDGVARAFDDASFSMWRGSVDGQPDSQAFLAFSVHGSRGWFGTPGSLHHLLSGPGAVGRWANPESRLVSERSWAALGIPHPPKCQLLQRPGSSPVATSKGSGKSRAPFYDAPIAFETDFEFYQLFNDLNAATAYAFALIGSVSARFREQMDVIFTLPYVGFHTTANDPWNSIDCFKRLEEFRSAWKNGGAPARAELYHMLSGLQLFSCSGAAYLNGLCDQNFGFGLSGNLTSKLPFPIAQGPLTWDFFVLAHELGHNFGSLHTHDYTPPIDRCPFGNCIPNGTNMSYCQGCPGGLRNITLRFHPRVVAHIRTVVAASCLKPFDGVLTEDLGFALAGSNGVPSLDVSYSAATVRVDVERAPTSQPGLVFVGVKRIDLPLAGGVLVPSPDVPIAVMSDNRGQVRLPIPIRASYPGGVIAWMQSWFQDPAGAGPLAATNGSVVELIKP